MEKRVLVYTNHYAPEQFKINEAVKWLIDEGHLVHVVTGWPNYPSGKIYKGYGPFKNSFEKKGKLTIRRLPLIPRGRATKLRLIINYLSFLLSNFLYTIYLIISYPKFDKLLVHHTSPFFIAFTAIFYKKFKKTKAILWELDLWPETLEAVGVIKSRYILNVIGFIVKMIYKHFDIVLISSESFKEKVLDRVSHEEVHYFPNWAEEILEENKLKKIKTTFLKRDSIKIVYTGNIGYAQDFEILANCINSKPKDLIQWIFVGEGRYKNQFRKMLHKQEKLGLVVFVSQQSLDKIPSWLAIADYLYLSLRNASQFSNTVPAKLQSYMASGKPIIAMLDGEGEKLIKKAECGLVSKPSNLNELDKVLNQALNMNPEIRKNLGKKGLDFYLENFHSTHRKNQLLDIINT